MEGCFELARGKTMRHYPDILRLSRFLGFLMVAALLLLVFTACSTTQITWKPLYPDTASVQEPSLEQKRAARDSASSRYREPEPVVARKEEKPRKSPEPLDPAVYGDLIRTRDGKVYQCRIVKQDEQMLYTSSPDGHFSIPKSMVERIDQAGSPEAASGTGPAIEVVK